MSGECDVCGEHTLDCKCDYEKNKFYFKGRFYLNFVEFMKQDEWLKQPLTEKQFDEMWIDLGKTIWINIKMYDRKKTNKYIYEVYDDILLACLKKLRDDKD